MIYFYNQPNLTVNWQRAYQQLSFKFQTLTKDYENSIQLRQKLRQKIEVTIKQNAILKAKKSQKLFQSAEKESSSSVPQKLANQKEMKMKNLKKPESKNIIKISESSSVKDYPQVYQCTYEGCQKAYSTEAALNVHMKAKHNGGTKQQDKSQERTPLKAQRRAEQIPRLDITFPQNFLEVTLNDIQAYPTGYVFENNFFM